MPFPLITRYGCLFLLLAAGGCNMLKSDRPSLKEYDLNKPEKFQMPGTLLEISGIAFNKGNPDTVYAIQDEQGKLFKLKWGVKKQYHTKFDKNGDYEDLAILDNQVIVLKSNGHLYSFPLPDSMSEETAGLREWKGLLPEGEYESIWADEASGQVYVLCKNCPAADSKISVPGYRLQFTAGELTASGGFSINVSQIRDIDGKVKRGFRPSALAKNPVTGEWFIISAVNQLLVTADSSWKVTNVYHLDGNRFNQPEGLAFDAKGNMYISNEGDHLSEGNILKFDRKQK
ncbi:MAG TPA: SdiA-regulated domain-containing protein [Chitinophagaceae bacterium]|nr:SdiA-regulated domain-containing protein [Chitinophagaceae bacterium]